jgi:Protein of unknown function (DUF3761)
MKRSSVAAGLAAIIFLASACGGGNSEPAASTFTTTTGQSLPVDPTTSANILKTTIATASITVGGTPIATQASQQQVAATTAPASTPVPATPTPVPPTATPVPPAATPRPPTPTTDPYASATAQCKDGTYSYSKTASGTCSSHGGVARWINHP